MSKNLAAILFIIFLSNQLSAKTLDEKLSHEWSKRARAQEVFQKKIGVDNGKISRSEWENLLKSDGEFMFTSDDITELRSSHAERIKEQKIYGEKKSILDLLRIKKDDRVLDFCHELPKGGMIHVHPWGTMDRETVGAILEGVNPRVNISELIKTLYAQDSPFILYPAELDFLFPYKQDNELFFSELSEDSKSRLIDLFFLPPGQHSFKRFLGVFTIISSLVFYNQANVDPETIMYDGFFKRAKRNNVDYVEISDFIFNPEADIPSLEKWASDIMTKYGIEARIIASFNRMKEDDFNRKSITKLLKAPKSKILVGINFVNDEESHPAFEKGQGLYGTLLNARIQNKTTLKGTIHAGELGDVRNIRDALIMGANRIGHGVKLMEDTATLEYAIQNKIPIEANILSNYYLGVVSEVKFHPFLAMLRLGLPVSLSTDDEGIFRTDLTKECEAALNNTDISYYELKELSKNSIQTSFADDFTKQKLTEKSNERFEKFEKKWAKYKIQ